MTIDVRVADPKDADAISIVLSSAYQHAQPVALARDLRDGGHFQHEIVAERAGVVLGYVSLVKLIQPSNWAALSFLSVSHSVQEQGLGGRLVVAALDAARAAKLEAVVAVGAPDFLKRYHFVTNAAANLRSEFMPDRMSLYPIRPGTALSDATVKFPAPFSK